MRQGLLLLTIPLFLLSCESMNKNKSTLSSLPQAQKIPHEMKLHGDVRVDPYFWMRERDSKQVLKYIQEENDYAKVHLAASKPIAEALFTEMKARIKEDDSSAPSKKGEYFYYTRYEKGKEYAI